MSFVQIASFWYENFVVMYSRVINISASEAFLLPDQSVERCISKTPTGHKLRTVYVQTEIVPVCLGCLTTAHCDRLFSCTL